MARHIDADGNTFETPVIFNSTVTQTGSQSITGNVTASGTVQGSDLTATDDLVVGDDATISGDLTVSGAVNFSGATSVTLPAGYSTKRYWVSGAITSLTGGQASQSVAVPTGSMGAAPTAKVVEAAYLVTTGTITSSNGNTTALTAALGVSGSTGGYLAAGSNLVGAGAGRKQNAVGSLLGSYRDNDAMLVTFTATGGAPDLVHIQSLSMIVVLFYVDPISGS